MSRRSRGRADAVVGAGYGDEGKGLLVDALAHGRGAGTVVVRHNGGAQAGHTVTAPDGRRHVFHHVGSGSLAGAATHLSRHFVSNPAILAREIDALAALGVAPRITADEGGLVTTPWDMMVNQFVEGPAAGRATAAAGSDSERRSSAASIRATPRRWRTYAATSRPCAIASIGSAANGCPGASHGSGNRASGCGTAT